MHRGGNQGVLEQQLFRPSIGQAEIRHLAGPVWDTDSCGLYERQAAGIMAVGDICRLHGLKTG